VTADEIATESERNRPVAHPYPKLMTSNLDVDQGGAVVMCSTAVADAAGVPLERRVFPWSGVGAHDHWFVTNRWAFDESPAMRLAGRRALELAATGHDDCRYLDLYSCFPAAVQVAQRELAIDPARDFTITGGLTFAGGPLNCYCILPLTRSVELLRSTPDERALLTGNGGWFTKHSMLVLSGVPSPRGFRTASVQADIDALPSRPTPTGPAQGRERLETFTVTYARDGRPDRAITAHLDEAGARRFSESRDPDVIAELLES
jgi:acetyl-CoA C-acetyltransferase